MVIPWTKKKFCRRARAGVGIQESPTELIIPTHFRCPISLDLMKDPVTTSTGVTYDRESIETWFEAGNVTCPMTNQVLLTFEPVPNHSIRRMIQDWCVENQCHGVERIPTPRIPITKNEVSQILGQITEAQEAQQCRELVLQLSKATKESERNKKCIAGNGSGNVLASTFETFAQKEGESVILLLEDTMIALTSLLPLDQEAIGSLKSIESLRQLVWFLNNGGLSGRQSSVMILKEVISSFKNKEKLIQKLVKIEGIIEGLVNVIKDPISPSSTKASLAIIYHLINSSVDETTIPTFVQMDLISLILEILVDAEKGICEKALGTLDGLCRAQIGRKAAQAHALTVPVVVKKILRVSGTATEFSVSVLWQLVEEEGESIGVVEEALQVGAFQKLLLILQLGWDINERTKEKMTKLLKVLNAYRGRFECTESMDFKDIKRPF